MKKNYTVSEVASMKQIAMLLRNDRRKKLSRLDYYLLGGISFNVAASIIYSMKVNGDLTAYEYYALNDYIVVQRNANVLYDKKIVLATKFIFSNKIITDLEKEVIWSELVNSGINEKDIDDIVFSAAVRAYAIRNGYVKIANTNVSTTKTLKK